MILRCNINTRYIFTSENMFYFPTEPSEQRLFFHRRAQSYPEEEARYAIVFFFLSYPIYVAQEKKGTLYI